MPVLIPIGLKLLTMVGFGPGRALQMVGGRAFGTVSTILATVIALGVGYASWRTWLFVHDRGIRSAALEQCRADAADAVAQLRLLRDSRQVAADTAAVAERMATIEREAGAAIERSAALEAELARTKAETRIMWPRDVVRILNK